MLQLSGWLRRHFRCSPGFKLGLPHSHSCVRAYLSMSWSSLDQ